MRLFAALIVLLMMAMPVYAVCESEKAQYDSAMAAYNTEKSVNNQQIMSASYQRYIACVGSAPSTAVVKKAEPIAHYDCSGYDCANYGNKLDYDPTKSYDPGYTSGYASDDYDKKPVDDGDIEIVGTKTPTLTEDEDFQVQLAMKLTDMLENGIKEEIIVDPNGDMILIQYKDGNYYLIREGNEYSATEYIDALEDEKSNYGTGLRTKSRKQELRKTTPEEYRVVLKEAGYDPIEREYKPITKSSTSRIKSKLEVIEKKGTVSQRERAKKLIGVLGRKVELIPDKKIDELIDEDKKKQVTIRKSDERVLKGAGYFKRFVVWMSGKIPIAGGTASKVYGKSLDAGIETGRMFAERNSARDKIWAEEFGYD